ncbi:MAG: Gfo/Idh/MocA family protein [Mycobacteriales bacterium]
MRIALSKATVPAPAARREVPTVGLVGVNGHGVSHLRRLGPAHAQGRLRLAAVCDVRPPGPEARALLPAGVPVYADHRALLAAGAPDVLVVVTPPPTHLAIAGDALRAGADVLLEKPPVTSLAEHDALAAVVAETGRRCQVGFQALGSAALDELLAAIRAGRLGPVTGIGAAGTWVRDAAYFRRAPWAGRRAVVGAVTADGALTNPFAHAVMTCLALVLAGGGPVTGIRVERYRAHDIEVDDTACLRIDTGTGVPVLVAVTLCAATVRQPRVLVYGEEGTAELYYAADELRLPGEAAARAVPGRIDLLTDLLAARDRPGAPLRAPLERTRPFTAVLERVLAAPLHPVPPERVTPAPGEPGRLVIAGIDETVATAAATLRLFSEFEEWPCAS